MIKGDLVRHKSLDFGLGTASHAEPTGDRWVVWRERSGSWGAGLYKPSDLDLVGLPETVQPAMRLERRRR
jgi:hypothetical protein